jgi:two-component system, cell cycle sensor histidine kinase and response regulator CckA
VSTSPGPETDDSQPPAGDVVTPTDVEQAFSDADRTASNSDRLAADSDQRASDRDQATADRDHDGAVDLTAADQRAYEASREQRDAATAERLESQVDRGTTARERELTGRYRAVLDVGPNGVVAIDSSGRIVFLNEPLARMFGYTHEELLDRPLEWLLPASSRAGHVGYRTGYVADPEARQMAVDQELAGRRKDGSEFPIEVSLSPIETDHGVQVFATVVDVTDRMAAESHRLHTQKLESIGRLTGGIAHDFNNMLFAIRGYAELLAQDFAPDRIDHLVPEEVRAAVQEITRAADRAAALTAQLLAFTRQQVVAPTVVDLDAAITHLIPMLHQLVAPLIDVRLALGSDGGRILADPGWTDQIVMNLVVNARDAMPGGGIVRIETARVDGASVRQKVGPAAVAEAYIAMSVADVGIGMDEATQKRVFEPFFTTKPIGKGTGLGLATTYGIVRQAGGHISVVSEPGIGSTFTLYFPLVDAVSHPEPPQRPPARATSVGRVLVVDDEAAVREVTTRLLKTAGWDVVAVPDSVRGIEVASTGEPFAVVVTDVVMPGMSGLALADQLLDAHPGTGVVLMSGFVESTLELAPLLAKGAIFVPKPVSGERLIDAVGRAAGRAPAAADSDPAD